VEIAAPDCSGGKRATGVENACLQSDAAFSTPAIFTPAIWCRDFHYRDFHPCIFATPAFSTPAFSVAPFYRRNLDVVYKHM